MTLAQRLVTVAICVAATMFTRFLPFAVFHGKSELPSWVDYLGKVLPLALFAFLVVYCLKDVTPLAGTHGIPEAISILVVAALYEWRGNTLVSMAAGTALYMVLVQLVFV